MECVSHVKYLFQSVSLNTTGSISLNDSPAPYVDILALGSGWTWSFFGPAAGERGLRTAFTTRDGRDGSVPFLFDPQSDDTSPFEKLPDAKTVVVIFPLYSASAAKRLVHGYSSTRTTQFSVDQEKPKESTIRFIVLGSTGVWNGGPTLQFAPLSLGANVGFSNRPKETLRNKPSSPWVDRHSPVDDVPRAHAEEAFLSLNNDDHDGHEPVVQTSVLCLSGLWGHGRSPRRFIARLAPSKSQLKDLKSVHFVHGHDVARAVLAMHDKWSAAKGQRWALTNERVYDLWDLISKWGNAGEDGRAHFPQGPQPKWVQELIAESNRETERPIRSLPRCVDSLGFAIDGTEFWNTFGLFPEVPWVD